MRAIRLLAICGVLLAGCARRPDADAIREVITAMAGAEKTPTPRDVLAHVSDDFIGNAGELDRRQLAGLLRARLPAGGIRVRLGAIGVELSGDRAIAHFDAALTDSSGRWIAEHRADLHFVTGWRRERGGWLCYNAGWTGPD